MLEHVSDSRRIASLQTHTLAQFAHFYIALKFAYGGNYQGADP
jgi:hypothetical protein